MHVINRPCTIYLRAVYYRIDEAAEIVRAYTTDVVTILIIINQSCIGIKRKRNRRYRIKDQLKIQFIKNIHWIIQGYIL